MFKSGKSVPDCHIATMFQNYGYPIWYVAESGRSNWGNLAFTSKNSNIQYDGAICNPPLFRQIRKLSAAIGHERIRVI